MYDFLALFLLARKLFRKRLLFPAIHWCLFNFVLPVACSVCSFCMSLSLEQFVSCFLRVFINFISISQIYACKFEVFFDSSGWISDACFKVFTADVHLGSNLSLDILCSFFVDTSSRLSLAFEVSDGSFGLFFRSLFARQCSSFHRNSDSETVWIRVEIVYACLITINFIVTSKNFRFKISMNQFWFQNSQVCILKIISKLLQDFFTSSKLFLTFIVWCVTNHGFACVYLSKYIFHVFTCNHVSSHFHLLKPHISHHLHLDIETKNRFWFFEL